MATEKIKIVVADDHELMRKSLIALLCDFDELDVIGDASNGKTLLQVLKRNMPDIVLLDIEMPVMNGREALMVIHNRYPDLKVIMLSMHKSHNLMVDLMTLGARSYLPKGCDVDVLIHTIHTVHEKGYYFTEDLSKAMLTGVMHEKAINPLLQQLALTDRELEVLQLLCEGKTAREIAEALKMTVRTVEFHRFNVYNKTKTSNLAELVKYAIKHGFISAD